MIGSSPVCIIRVDRHALLSMNSGRTSTESDGPYFVVSIVGHLHVSNEARNAEVVEQEDINPSTFKVAVQNASLEQARASNCRMELSRPCPYNWVCRVARSKCSYMKYVLLYIMFIFNQLRTLLRNYPHLTQSNLESSLCTCYPTNQSVLEEH